MNGWNRVSFNSTADRVDHVESFAPARFGTIFVIELTTEKTKKKLFLFDLETLQSFLSEA